MWSLFVGDLRGRFPDKNLKSCLSKILKRKILINVKNHTGCINFPLEVYILLNAHVKISIGPMKINLFKIQCLIWNQSLTFLMRCDGSDGKAKDSGLQGSGFNPQPRQVLVFRLVSLEPMRSTSNNLPYCCKYRW